MAFAVEIMKLFIYPFAFAEEELSSLKEELQHFQRKIEKHEWISNRIEDAEADVKEGKMGELIEC